MSDNKIAPNDNYEVSTDFQQNEYSQTDIDKANAMMANANTVIQSATAFMQTDAAISVAETLKEVALGYRSYKEHLAKLEDMDKHMEDMQTKFDRMEPELKKANERLDDFYSDLKKLQGQEMTEKEEKQYNGLLYLIRKQMDDLVHLYDSIMN